MSEPAVIQKVLFVDDELKLLSAIYRQLRREFQIETAAGGELGLESLSTKGPYAVVVSDMRMPGMDGVEFLRRVRERSPGSVRIMLTGNADQETAASAINHGSVFRFLSKPCSTEELSRALREGLEHYRLASAERELLEETLRGTVRVLTEVLAMSDSFAAGRAARVLEELRGLAQALAVECSWELEVATMLCPIGTMSIPQEVIAKSRAGQMLSSEEQAMFTRIPEVGHQLLCNVPRLEHVAQIVRCQGKHYDGGGDDALRGEELPLGARMIKVLADLLDLEAAGVARASALVTLSQRHGVYDPRLLKTLQDAHGQSRKAPETSGAERGVRVTLAGLRVGLRLCSDIYSQDGRLLISSGHVLSEVLLAKIRNYARIFGLCEPILVERPRNLE